MPTLKPCFSMYKGYACWLTCLNNVYHRTLCMSILDEFVCGVFFFSEEHLGQIFHFEGGKEPLMEGVTLHWRPIRRSILVLTKSISSGAQYVTLQIKRGQTCRFGLAKYSFGPAFVHSLLRPVKGITKSLTRALDWLHSLIDPDGLHLSVCHLFAVPVLVLWVGLEKKEVNN
jgi:hypothetical protein